MSLHKLKDEYVYDGMTLCMGYPRDLIDRIRYSFELRDDDTIIATYSRSGTTWISEIVWLIKNQCNTSKANAVKQDERVPYLEINPGKKPLPIDVLEAMTTPRIIKTHLPYRYFQNQLESKKTKVVFGARNIKDNLVSLYHFYRMCVFFNFMKGPFEEFFELFKQKQLFFGDWFDFNLSYWNNRSKYNFLLVKYEDLVKDFSGSVKKIADFLEVELTEEQIAIIAEHVHFDSMQKNDNINKSWMNKTILDQSISQYIRKGKVGDWKNHFTLEQLQYVDALYKEKMDGTGLDFDFEI